MAYNSIDQFINEREADLVPIVEAAQRRAGGHYGQMTPAELHANAANDTQYMVNVWRSRQADRAGTPRIAQQADGAGVELDDLIRMIDALTPAILAFVKAELQAQPDLYEELVRRIQHSASNYRSSVMAAKLGKTLQRLQKPAE